MQAAVQFLSALPVNSYVGLIAFHGRVQTLAGLTLMKDRDSWQNLKVIKLFFSKNLVKRYFRNASGAKNFTWVHR